MADVVGSMESEILVIMVGKKDMVELVVAELVVVELVME